MEAIAVALFVVFMGLFVVVERAWPGRLAVDRRRDLGWDVASLIVGTIAAGASQLVLRKGVSGSHVAGGGLEGWVALLPAPARIMIGAALVDLGLYAIHRAMHAWNFLWPAHRWHHSATNLYWLSGFRASVTHTFLYAVPQVLVSVFVLGMRPLDIVGVTVILAFFQFYIHSSTDVGLGRLGWLFVTPRYHRLHHSPNALQSKNLGAFLTIWDRMLGTYVDPDRTPAPAALGLGEERSAARMIVGV